MERYRVRALAWSSLAIAFITASFIEESDKENELFYPLFLTGALLIGVAVLEHAYAYSQDQVYPVPADATAYQHNRIAEAMDHVEVMAGLPRSAHAVTATAQPENLALPLPGQDQAQPAQVASVLVASQPGNNHPADVLDHVEVMAELPRSVHVAAATAQPTQVADVLAVSQPESDHSADVLDHVEVVAEPPKSAHVAPATAQAENLALPFPGQDQSEGQAQVQTQGPSSVLNKTAGDEYSDLMVSSVTLTAAPENPAQKSGHWWAGMRIDSPAPVPAIVVAKSATSMRQIRYEGVDDVLMTDYERL